jgi:Ser/Thr protein kinase RdoA (MazF antagonist)
MTYASAFTFCDMLEMLGSLVLVEVQLITPPSSDATYLPASHSLIVPDALTEIVRETFDLVASAPLRLIQRGLNDHYSLSTRQGEFVLRVYRHGWRSNADVQWELDLLQHVHTCGAPVAAPVPCRDGQWFTTLQAIEGVRQVAVFQQAPGRYTHFGSASQNRISPAACAEAFGRSMAHIHAAADTYQASTPRFPLDFNHLLDQPLAAIAHIFADFAREVDHLRMLTDDLRQLLAPALLTADRGACHGDMSGGNSTYWQGQVIHFDFDCAGPSWRAYDLGVFYWSLSINGHADDVWSPFLRGYRDERSISEADLRCVVAFAAIRVIWLMGLWCANAQHFGHHSLHAEYFAREYQRFDRLYAQAKQTLCAT